MRDTASSKFISKDNRIDFAVHCISVIWRERERRGRGLLSLGVIGTFLLAVVLHALWNIINSFGGQTALQLLNVTVGNLAIAGISLMLIFRRIREAIKTPVNNDR